MLNKRKYVSTEYGMVNLRDGDTILHLDPEILADIYWRVTDGVLTEVVRCKDCVYAIIDPYGMSCTTLCMDTSDDHYCWWGERKEDAETN